MIEYIKKGRIMSIVKQTALVLLATLGLHAAILDDLAEKISHYTSHLSHKRHHIHHKHHIHTVSKEQQWQYALQFLGYYHGNIDGDLLTPESYHAIEQFQFAHQTLATGFLENRYKPYLSDVYRQVALQHDMMYDGAGKGKLIRKKQAALAILGYYNGKIDGKFGSKSKEAWKDALEKFGDEKTLFDYAQKVVEERLRKMKHSDYFAQHYKKDASQTDEVLL